MDIPQHQYARKIPDDILHLTFLQKFDLHLVVPRCGAVFCCLPSDFRFRRPPWRSDVRFDYLDASCHIWELLRYIFRILVSCNTSLLCVCRPGSWRIVLFGIAGRVYGASPGYWLHQGCIHLLASGVSWILQQSVWEHVCFVLSFPQQCSSDFDIVCYFNAFLSLCSWIDGLS